MRKEKRESHSWGQCKVGDRLVSAAWATSYTNIVPLHSTLASLVTVLPILANKSSHYYSSKSFLKLLSPNALQFIPISLLNYFKVYIYTLLSFLFICHSTCSTMWKCSLNTVTDVVVTEYVKKQFLPICNYFIVHIIMIEKFLELIIWQNIFHISVTATQPDSQEVKWHVHFQMTHYKNKKILNSFIKNAK